MERLGSIGEQKVEKAVFGDGYRRGTRTRILDRITVYQHPEMIASVS